MAITIAVPAFADNDSYTNNQTYTNSCTVNVLGESSGTATANAQWSTNSYTCSAGTYLPDGDSWSGLDDGCQTCPENSYCPGGTFTYSESTDQGINSCPSGYTSSSAGASADTECYTACTINDVPHSTSVIGNNYYGNGIDTCEPANSNSCTDGYHYVAGSSGGGNSGGSNIDLNTLIGTERIGDCCDSIGSDGSVTSTTQPCDILTSSNTNEFVVNFSGTGLIHGHARRSNQTGTSSPRSTATDITEVSNGDECWCKLDGYTPDGGTLQNLTADWVYATDMTNGNLSNCARTCALRIQKTTFIEFRTAMFDSVHSDNSSGNNGAVSELAQCVPNTININWGPIDTTTNQPFATGSCIYDGDLVTPTTAPTKRGHTFTGWTFSIPSQN